MTHSDILHHIPNDQQSLLSIKPNSGKVLQLTRYWSPPVPCWEPLKRTLNSTLRMACVVENRIYQGLRFEGQVLLLTPDNWEHVLKHGRPDFLLMESIWETATGHWHIGQSSGSPGRDELLEIVFLAGKLSIPTVFWITKGHEYHAHYKAFARHFDYVFCADLRETELLRVEGVKAEVLFPCIQPALYNPFRYYEYYDTFSLSMLYDGWADLDRMGDDLRVLQEVKPYGLNIIESRYQIFHKRKDLLPDYVDCIIGSISKQSLIQALRYAKAYITLGKTLSTTTSQQWMTLEATASRLPVIHHGTLAQDDIRKKIVIECPEQEAFLGESLRFQEDDLYRERVAHLGWRDTYQKHTFAHRMQKICKAICIEHDWEEYPKVSLITPTFRRELLPHCVKKYAQQTYSNKELILVFNGEDIPASQELGLEMPRYDVKIANVPGEMFAGACLNRGHSLATGEYFLRMDDDDWYGPNYTLDMILQARSLDALFFGKPPCPIHFVGSQEVYVRKSSYPLSIILKKATKRDKQWIGGNSICVKKDIFTSYCYQNVAFGAADTNLLYTLSEDDDVYFCIMDRFNLVADRRSDQNTHTWKIKDDNIKKNSSIYKDIGCVML